MGRKLYQTEESEERFEDEIIKHLYTWLSKHVCCKIEFDRVLFSEALAITLTKGEKPDCTFIQIACEDAVLTVEEDYDYFEKVLIADLADPNAFEKLFTVLHAKGYLSNHSQP